MTLTTCSFCNKNQKTIKFLIEKPGVSICNECVSFYNELLLKPAQGETTKLFEECSFCSFMKTMSSEDLAGTTPPKKGMRLIRNGQFCICDECLDVCQEIAFDHQKSA